MNMLEFMLAMTEERMTKDEFGELVHSADQAEVDRALKALEVAGGYDNLDD